MIHYNKSMKKTVCIILLISMVFMCACTGQGINDKETGEVITGEKKHTYRDGVYTAYFKYFDGDGWCGVMRVSVEEGLITAISFDKYDTTYARFTAGASVQTADEIQQFKTEVKNLNAAVFQSQECRPSQTDESGSVPAQYRLLMNKIISMAETDADTVAAVDCRRKYSVKSAADADGTVSHLSVTYENGFIIDISFYRTDTYGLKISNFLDSESQLSYDEEIAMLCNVTENMADPLREAATTPVSPTLLQTYNDLCAEITAMRLEFDITAVHFPSVK